MCALDRQGCQHSALRCGGLAGWQAGELSGGKQRRTHSIWAKSATPAELKLWPMACPADGRPARARRTSQSGTLLGAGFAEQDRACSQRLLALQGQCVSWVGGTSVEHLLDRQRGATQRADFL